MTQCERCRTDTIRWRMRGEQMISVCTRCGGINCDAVVPQADEDDGGTDGEITRALLKQERQET